MMEKNRERLASNVALLKNQDPDLAELAEKCLPQKWSQTIDRSGSLNLINNETKEYLHSSEGPLKEAERWASTIKLQDINTIFLYGIGLGVYYEPLRDWLKEKDNHLIFIEDELEILHHFLETERAVEILKNPKVRITLLQKKRKQVRFEELMLQFAFKPYQVTALMYYIKKKVDSLLHLNMVIEYMINTHKWVSYEYESLGLPFYRNFYVNLLKLPESKIGSLFFDQFRGKPAIICGAGPSLKKNISLLRELKDKALIIAGGTAVNALNAAGINPHFGVGIDPNEDHALRILTNEAYMVPYFYHLRIYHTALNLLHGDIYYQNTKKSYPISYWIEKELSIPSLTIESGYNVVNTSFDLAYALGCTPIITVGTDLAYSEGESYAPILSTHPIAEGSLKFVTKTESEELIPRVDIQGKPVLTLWKWMLEAVWYSKFLVNHPDAVVINATEGGIGFPGVPNMALKEVEESYLTTEYDWEGLIHAISSRSLMPKSVNLTALRDSLLKAKESLERILTITKELIREWMRISEEEQEEFPLTKEMSAKIAALEKEDAYAFLEPFDERYVDMIQKEVQSLEINKGILNPQEITSKKAYLQKARYELFLKAASLNLNYINKTIAHMESLLKQKGAKVQRNVIPPKNSQEKGYLFNETEFSIKDTSLSIAFTENPSSPQEKIKHVENLPGTSIQWEYYKKEGLLHGPSLFQDQGKILSKSWYRFGKKNGHSSTYYADGSIASSLGFNEGKPHGDHLYYYEDGSLRARIGYEQGKLNGRVELYHQSGILKRLIEYKQGLKEGEEALYTEKGERIIEAYYSMGKPQGSARYLAPSGNVLKEVIYRENGEVERILVAGREGKLVEVSQSGKDFFDAVTQETENLTESLKNIFTNLKEFLEEIKKEREFLQGHEDLILSLNEGLKEIDEELQKLSEIGSSLIKESSLGFKEKEPIWKTPATKKILNVQVTVLQDAVGKGIEKVRYSIDQVVKAYVAFHKKREKK